MYMRALQRVIYTCSRDRQRQRYLEWLRFCSGPRADSRFTPRYNLLASPYKSMVIPVLNALVSGIRSFRKWLIIPFTDPSAGKLISAISLRCQLDRHVAARFGLTGFCERHK